LCNLTRENAAKLSEKIKAESTEKMHTQCGKAKCIRRSTKEVLGVSRIGGGEINGPWGWNE